MPTTFPFSESFGRDNFPDFDQGMYSTSSTTKHQHYRPPSSPFLALTPSRPPSHSQLPLSSSSSSKIPSLPLGRPTPPPHPSLDLSIGTRSALAEHGLLLAQRGGFGTPGTPAPGQSVGNDERRNHPDEGSSEDDLPSTLLPPTDEFLPPDSSYEDLSDDAFFRDASRLEKLRTPEAVKGRLPSGGAAAGLDLLALPRAMLEGGEGQDKVTDRRASYDSEPDDDEEDGEGGGGGEEDDGDSERDSTDEEEEDGECMADIFRKVMLQGEAGGDLEDAGGSEEEDGSGLSPLQPRGRSEEGEGGTRIAAGGVGRREDEGAGRPPSSLHPSSSSEREATLRQRQQQQHPFPPVRTPVRSFSTPLAHYSGDYSTSSSPLLFPGVGSRSSKPQHHHLQTYAGTPSLADAPPRSGVGHSSGSATERGETAGGAKGMPGVYTPGLSPIQPFGEEGGGGRRSEGGEEDGLGGFDGGQFSGGGGGGMRGGQFGHYEAMGSPPPFFGVSPFPTRRGDRGDGASPSPLVGDLSASSPHQPVASPFSTDFLSFNGGGGTPEAFGRRGKLTTLDDEDDDDRAATFGADGRPTDDDEDVDIDIDMDGHLRATDIRGRRDGEGGSRGGVARRAGAGGGPEVPEAKPRFVRKQDERVLSQLGIQNTRRQSPQVANATSRGRRGGGNDGDDGATGGALFSPQQASLSRGVLSSSLDESLQSVSLLESFDAIHLRGGGSGRGAHHPTAAGANVSASYHGSSMEEDLRFSSEAKSRESPAFAYRLNEDSGGKPRPGERDDSEDDVEGRGGGGSGSGLVADDDESYLHRSPPETRRRTQGGASGGRRTAATDYEGRHQHPSSVLSPPSEHDPHGASGSGGSSSGGSSSRRRTHGQMSSAATTGGNNFNPANTFTMHAMMAEAGKMGIKDFGVACEYADLMSKKIAAPRDGAMGASSSSFSSTSSSSNLADRSAGGAAGDLAIRDIAYFDGTGKSRVVFSDGSELLHMLPAPPARSSQHVQGKGVGNGGGTFRGRERRVEDAKEYWKRRMGPKFAFND